MIVYLVLPLSLLTWPHFSESHLSEVSKSVISGWLHACGWKLVLVGWHDGVTRPHVSHPLRGTCSGGDDRFSEETGKSVKLLKCQNRYDVA